jgi:hypothetical protein
MRILLGNVTDCVVEGVIMMAGQALENQEKILARK